MTCTARTPATACALGNGSGPIHHVIYLQFDNTHLNRDRAAVPSDLEQMPHLLNFIRGNGTMMANDHTILISHTAGGILSSLTGVYPDRNGQTVSNSYVRTSATGSFSFPSSFQYWTDTVATGVPNMITPTGQNMPAPWVDYTRAGCDVGGVATANAVLETASASTFSDVATVFGTSSPQFAEAQASAAAAAGTAARNKAQTDFIGLGVHCAQGSSFCAGGVPDLLPGEPGGYTGFTALFGAQSVDPKLTGQPASVPLTSMLGNPIVDAFGQPGFPGFDGMEAENSLRYVASMQEAGIPVTYAYISDAHDNHSTAQAMGPGQAAYEQQLAGLRPGLRQLLHRAGRARHRQVEHAVRHHRRRGGSLRRRHAEPGHLRRREQPLRLDRPDRRDPVQHRHGGAEPIPVALRDLPLVDRHRQLHRARRRRARLLPGAPERSDRSARPIRTPARSSGPSPV